MKTAAEVFDASLNGEAIRFRIAWLDFLIAFVSSLPGDWRRVVGNLRLDRAEAVIYRRNTIAELERRDTP